MRRRELSDLAEDYFITREFAENCWELDCPAEARRAERRVRKLFIDFGLALVEERRASVNSAEVSAAINSYSLGRES